MNTNQQHTMKKQQHKQHKTTNITKSKRKNKQQTIKSKT